MQSHETALCVAAYGGHTEAVRILLAAGADVNAQGTVSLHDDTLQHRLTQSRQCVMDAWAKWGMKA